MNQSLLHRNSFQEGNCKWYCNEKSHPIYLEITMKMLSVLYKTEFFEDCADVLHIFLIVNFITLQDTNTCLCVYTSLSYTAELNY